MQNQNNFIILKFIKNLKIYLLIINLSLNFGYQLKKKEKKIIKKNHLNYIFLIFLDSISLDFLEKNLDLMPFTKKFF